jgi:uncharacterized protein (TIGR02246 family)
LKRSEVWSGLGPETEWRLQGEQRRKLPFAFRCATPDAARSRKSVGRAAMTRPLMLAASVLSLMTLATVAIAQNIGSASDEAAIRRVIAAMTDGFNRHDAEAATRMYNSDADFVSVRGEVGIGREAAERGLRRIFETRAKQAALKTEDVRIRFIRDDVALAHVTNELSGLVTPDGQNLPSHKELSLRVFVKDGAEWRVASFHNTILAPFALPAPDGKR